MYNKLQLKFILKLFSRSFITITFLKAYNVTWSFSAVTSVLTIASVEGSCVVSLHKG